MPWILRIAFIIATLCDPLPAHASNRDVPLDDPIYRTIDAAVANGRIPAIHYGQRPWSESYIEALLDDAAHTEPSRGVTMPAPRIRVEGSFATTAGSTTPRQNALGTITLQAAPLDVFREGRDVPGGGGGLFLDVYQTAGFGSWASLAVEPRGWIEFGTNGQTASAHGTLWEALLKLGTRHIELSIGRGRVLWGPAEHGGLLLSDHAPPLDLVRLRTPQPFRLPWFFRHIGTIQTSLLFAHMGSRYTPANTILSGYRVDIQPHPWVTVGLNHLVMMGGAGLTDPSASEAITEFIGFVNPGHGNATTNHQDGVDLHVRIPPWRGAHIYAAYANEDPDTVLVIQFDSQAAWMLGTYLPRLTSDGRWRLRAEYWRGGAGMYRHSTYTDGWTLQGHGLGNPFGADSNGAWLALYHDMDDGRLAGSQIEVRAGVVQRSSNTYQTLTNAAGDRTAIEEAIDGPEEVTAFARGQLTTPLGKTLTGTVAAGYGHAWNAGFVTGQRQHQALALATLEWRSIRSRRQSRTLANAGGTAALSPLHPPMVTP